MRLFVRLSLLGLVALVAIGFAINQLQQKPDGSQGQAKVTVSVGQCAASGTTLVVDFGTNQTRTVIEKCVTNFSGTSWDFFEAAEVSIEGTEKYPVGFLCRVESFPNQATERCLDTPGANSGSWAYYTAGDGTWKYSTFGAATHKVHCGVAEGWRYLEKGEGTSLVPKVTPKKYVCKTS